MVRRFGEEAIAAFDEVITRSRHATQPAMREQLAGALLNKTFILGELERHDESVATLTELITHFHDDPNEVIESLVLAARQHREQLLEDPEATAPEIALWRRDGPGARHECNQLVAEAKLRPA